MSDRKRRWIGRVAAGVISLLLAGGCERTATAPPSEVQTARESRAAPLAGEPARTAELAEPAPGVEPPGATEPAPLLLLEDEPAGGASNGPGADNSRCFVCHANYVDEELAVTHARRDVGCAKCHGASDAHIADESWASGGNGTAPDRMYPRDQIDAGCMQCHPKDKIATPQHQAIFLDASGQKVCTDCHGNHRLPQRRCKWK